MSPEQVQDQPISQISAPPVTTVSTDDVPREQRGEEFKDDVRRALPKELVQRLSQVSAWRSSWSVLQELLVLASLIGAALYWWPGGS